MYTKCLHAVLVCLLLSLAGIATAQFDGPDILIQNGTVVATATDYEMEGTMWAAFTRLEDSATYVYRSADHGLSWQYRSALRAFGEPMDRIGFVVGEGDSAFNYLFYLSSYNNGDLWVARRDPQSDSFWLFPVCVGQDTVRDFAVCRDYTGDNYWLYAVVTNPDTFAGYHALRFYRSSTYGREWSLTDSCNGQWTDPYISAGAGSYIYFTAWSELQTVNALSLWVNKLWLSAGHWSISWWPLGTDELADPVVASAFTEPDSLAAIWCLWSQNYHNSGDWDVKSRYWTGGTGWSEPAYLAGSTQADEGYPDLRNYTSLGNQYINASYISDDNVFRTVYRRYAQASTPDQWSDTLRINEGSAGTGSEIRPKLCYSPGGPFSGAGCVFVGAGLNGCWWNAPYPTGVAAPEQAVATTRLDVRPSIGRGPFHVRASAPATVTIHDRTGRQVRTLALDLDCRAVWNGADDRGHQLADGVYFCRFSAGDYRATEKLVLQR